MNRIIKRLAVPLSAAAVLGTAGFAYMAANSMPSNTNAGTGSSPISGYTVSNVHYNLHNNGGSIGTGTGQEGISGNMLIGSVRFDLSPAIDLNTGTMYALVKDGTRQVNYNSCVLTNSPSTYTCSIGSNTGQTQASLLGGTSLQVTASQ